MIPLFHDLRNEQVVIFGGGSVAARKASRFETEATVIVASATFHERFEDLPCRRIRTEIRDPLVESLVADAFLVIPATDDQGLNRRIEALAREADCLVNPVDRRGNTVTPSTVEGSNITIAISTEGRSPGVSKYLRRRLESEIDSADGMVEVQSRLRTALSDRSESERRDRLWRVLEDDEVWEAIEEGALDRAETLAREHV